MSCRCTGCLQSRLLYLERENCRLAAELARVRYRGIPGVVREAVDAWYRGQSGEMPKRVMEAMGEK